MKSSNIKKSKKEIRHDMSLMRNELSLQDREYRSKEIFNKLLSLNILNNKINVLTYVNYNSEVNTRLIIDYCFKNSINVYTPKVDGHHMDFYLISSYSQLQSGAYGILEPETTNIYVPDYFSGYNSTTLLNSCDIIIIPGLVFDTNGNRLGYGGGYYDRYLNRYNNLIKIAVCYDFQIIDNNIIPVETYDIKPDIIITDKQIIKIKQ